jgi:hypothetical protein
MTNVVSQEGSEKTMNNFSRKAEALGVLEILKLVQDD